MSWKTTILILVLALFTAGLLYLALKNPSVNRQTSTNITPTVSPAHTLLSMSPESASASSQRIVDVNIDTQNNKVTAAQLELSYDPALLTNVSVAAGPFFNTPTILLNNVDSADGRISFAVAVQLTNGPQMGKGVVAKISYNTVVGATGEAKLSFLPKTQVTAAGVLDSVLKGTTDLAIPLPTAAVQTIPATSSAQ